ncbi:MAG: hypothetical protein ABIR61_11895 [Casimicrobiaceae bacterium]
MVEVNALDYACTPHRIVVRRSAPEWRHDTQISVAIVLEHVRGVLTAPDVIAQRARGNPAPLKACGNHYRPIQSTKVFRDRQAEWLTDAVAKMGHSTALAERLRKTEAE